jgi:UDP-glucose 4-epimerase
MRVKDTRQTFLGIWLKRLIAGEPFEVWGDGTQIRDFNYVDDVVEALLVCGISAAADGQIFNLGADETINLKDLAALLVEINGSGEYKIIPFPPDRKPIDIGDYYGDYRLIRGRLGWRPQVALAEGLRKTIEFYRAEQTYYF